MKEDAPAPSTIPRKRRALRQAPDVWIATWLAHEHLAAADKRRLLAEKADRKRAAPMIVGFTGTRAGVTPQQRDSLLEILEARVPGAAHHGDCVGADEFFHRLCVRLGIGVVLHPPENPRLRAFCTGAIETKKPRAYLDRNKDIVKACDLLIATPKETSEPASMRGQGTWSTVRYARTRGVALAVVMPNGDINEGGT